MKDTHGSVVGYYNANGERMTQYEYDAFGNILKGSDPDPFGYCGEYYDSESGNIYLRARYYNSTTGRFISEDPAKDGVNWYVYCSGNPVMLVDPTGLSDREGNENTELNDVIDFIENTDAIDWQGAQILLWYLRGNGENHFIDNDPKWTEYMEANDILTQNVKGILLNIFNSMENGTNQWLDITTSMEIENGENMVGYEYLHGTNGDLQHYLELGATVNDVGFRIIGNVNKLSNGVVKYSLIFEWNDIIDPNPQYTTDIKKNEFAEQIADPQEYILRIKWNSSGIYNPNFGPDAPTWPFGYFE